MHLRFSLQNISFGRGFFLSFMLGFVVRLVPEVLSYPYPIGFDTIGYAVRIKSGVVWYDWTWAFSTWLLYAVLIPVYRIVQVDPFVLLKSVAPMFYALNVCGVYYFARKALNWETRKALIAAVFFAFQLAALRMSWDLYRNTLGLAILLFALPWIREVETKKGFVLFILLSMLVVFGHETASVIMLSVVLGVIMKDFFDGEKARLLRVLAAILPALAILLMSVYLGMFPAPFPVEAIVISVNDTAHPSPGGLFFLVNYLGISDPVQYYPTYLHLISHVFSLFAVLYLLCLPLVFVGFFRDKILNGWTLLVLIGSFSSLITPFCALDAWARWMLMLVYPFTFYATNGIGKVLELRGRSVNPDIKWLKWMKLSRRRTVGILLCMGLLGSLFMVVRWGDGGILYTPTTILYVPSTMLHNSVPLQDVRSTVEAVEWLSERMNDGSSVLVHHAFLSWALLYLDEKNVIIYYTKDVQAALNVALQHGSNSVYLLWWNENIGWYDLTVPNDFVSIFSSGRISVFERL